MRISGGNEALPGGTPVQITVYYPGHTPEGIMSGEYGLSDAICYMAETEAEDKAYSFAPFRLKDTAVRGSSYLIIVNAENIGAGRTEYYYTPHFRAEGVLNSVNSASAETLFNTVISNGDILMIDASGIRSLIRKEKHMSAVRLRITIIPRQTKIPGGNG